MRHKKLLNLFSPAIALCMTAFFTIGSAQAAPPTPVFINSAYDLTCCYPTFTGTYTITGAIESSGTVTMVVDFNSNGTIAHCLYTFVDGNGNGTITIREECVFATNPARGSWKIIGGTGVYANLQGNGSALMPGNEENWEGVIY